MKTSQLVLPALLLASLLLFGCIEQGYYDRSMQGSGVIIDGAGSSDLCARGNCNCMVCDTYPFYGAKPIAKFYPFSYKHSECQFLQCTFDQFSSYVQSNPSTRPGAGTSASSGEDMLNFFMFGQGGFGEFNRANTFCNNSLRMPVKWLDSRYGNNEYPMPDKSRAECFLDKGAMPVYILYSDGKHIDATRSRQIAENLRGALFPTGPIIITSEMNFNSSNPDTVSKVKEQVRAMKAACPECLIALAPRIWDESAALDGIMQEAGTSIDIFAFGIDSNNYTSCSPLLMLSDATQYSQYLLYKYKKPSILAYVLFDNTTSSDGSCTWDDSLVSEGYSAFFTYPQGFTSSGILGGSLYSLYGVADPLGCTDCGLYNSSGAPIPQRQASWFSGCQGAYATSSVVPLVFSDAPGTTCSYSQPGYSFVGPDFNTAQPTYTEPAGSWKPFYSCDSCLVEKIPDSIKLKPIIPDDDSVCTAFPALDAYADVRDLDPALVRTSVKYESGFKPCAVSPADTSAPCGRSMETQLYSISDPDEGCFVETGYTYSAGGDRLCAIGLMQTEVVPYTYWGTVHDTTGLIDVAKGCAYKEDEKFNPFNPEHSACLGTYELAEAVDWADGILDSKGSQMGLTMSEYSEEYKNTRGLLTVYLARLYYVGPALWRNYGNNWISKFQEFSHVDCSGNSEHPCCSGDHLNSNLVDEGCCGPSADFINFVSNEECFKIRDPASGEKGDNKHYIINARDFARYYLGLRQKCGICDQDALDENIDEWARTHGAE
jgi:hypothetical protein